MKYKILVQDELDQLLPALSGGNCRSTKDPVEIIITIEVEKGKYQAILQKILKVLQKS